MSDEKLYDIWKSKVYDKSYADFKNEMMTKWKKNTGIETSETMTDEEMETTINDSYEILNSFNLIFKKKRGGNKC